MPSFSDVYSCIAKAGSAYAISSKGTKYEITACELTKGNHVGERAIVAKPTPNSRIYIHEDCWGENITCGQTRAGGIYNGDYTIYEWYYDFIKGKK